MTRLFFWLKRGLVLEGWPSKIEVSWDIHSFLCKNVSGLFCCAEWILGFLEICGLSCPILFETLDCSLKLCATQAHVYLFQRQRPLCHGTLSSGFAKGRSKPRPCYTMFKQNGRKLKHGPPVNLFLPHTFLVCTLGLKPLQVHLQCILVFKQGVHRSTSINLNIQVTLPEVEYDEIRYSANAWDFESGFPLELAHLFVEESPPHEPRSVHLISWLQWLHQWL